MLLEMEALSVFNTGLSARVVVSNTGTNVFTSYVQNQNAASELGVQYENYLLKSNGILLKDGSYVVKSSDPRVFGFPEYDKLGWTDGIKYVKDDPLLVEIKRQLEEGVQKLQRAFRPEDSTKFVESMPAPSQQRMA